ncbi:MAG: serine protease [candidate division Zixibacteria bacterium SM23_73_2]|nr:MAG: serine protease [candidate division Zixibacteria bacterium SM23_73_2]
MIFADTEDERSKRHVNLVRVDGPIGPISARIIINAISSSVEDSAEALVIELNTPGGLDDPMRSIVSEILNSGVPVMVYVSPSGSRAASAGVFITLSAHIAAMAPGTNIGAAHPVGIGGQIDSTMVDKITNDAAAYIKSIATKRERNAEWAEKAVRESVSETEYDALKLNIIDLIAENLRDLLDQCDGKKVLLPSGEKELKTEKIEVKRIEIDWRDEILNIISNPNIAYVLYTLGMLGLFFELSNPGSIIPGVVGAICLILAFFAFQTLPINYAGLLLMLLALLFFFAEIKVPSHGALTIGGIISMLLGSLMLFESPLPYLRASLGIIITIVAATALFFIFAVGMGLRAQRRKATTGDRGMIGLKGVARSKLDPEGYVFVHGEIWKATADMKIEKGEKIKVIGVEDLTLKVTKLKAED